MKSSGVLATLMLAAVAGYASAQCTDAETLVNNADGVGSCTNDLAADGVTACLLTMTDGTCTNTICANAATTVTAGTCTANTYDWVYNVANFPGCTGTEGTTAVETVRTGQCEKTAPADVGTETAGKCTGTIDLTETCPEVENTCANAGLDCTAAISGNAATLTVAKAGTTACGSTGSDPTKVPVVCTVALCCELPKCDAYTCGAGVKKASPATISGADDTTCCDATCDTFTCGSGFIKKASPAGITGADDATCCDALATCASDTTDAAPRACTSPAVDDTTANCAGAACADSDFGADTTNCCKVAPVACSTKADGVCTGTAVKDAGTKLCATDPCDASDFGAATTNCCKAKATVAPVTTSGAATAAVSLTALLALVLA